MSVSSDCHGVRYDFQRCNRYVGALLLQVIHGSVRAILCYQTCGVSTLMTGVYVSSHRHDWREPYPPAVEDIGIDTFMQGATNAHGYE